MICLIPTTTELLTKGLIDIYMKQIWKLHGIPKKITSNRGPQFTSELMKELCTWLGIQQNLSLTCNTVVTLSHHIKILSTGCIGTLQCIQLHYFNTLPHCASQFVSSSWQMYWMWQSLSWYQQAVLVWEHVLHWLSFLPLFFRWNINVLRPVFLLLIFSKKYCTFVVYM